MPNAKDDSNNASVEPLFFARQVARRAVPEYLACLIPTIPIGIRVFTNPAPLHTHRLHSTMAQNPSYPVHLIVTDRPCLIVGAGNVALRKAEGLIKAGADVTVIGPNIHPDFATMSATTIERSYRAGEVADYWLAITCTDDTAVNRQVYLEGEAAGVWVNSADDPANCAWILPSVARNGDLAITVSTNGRSPALASWLRRRFEAEFDHHYIELLDLLAEVRAEAKEHFGTSEVSGWNESLDDNLFGLVAAGDRSAARSQLRTALGLAA